MTGCRLLTRGMVLFFAALAAVWFASETAAQNTSAASYLSQIIEGQVLNGGAGGYNSTDTLANYLRRGPRPLFQPSQPVYYVEASSEQDVVSAVQFALNIEYKLSLRGGGHHQAGVSLQQGGITVDLGQLKDVHIDPVTYSCRFQAGLQELELANITSQHSLHYRIGHASSNGVAGFTLGGGGGWGGLAVDQITGFDVVNTWEYPSQELQIKHVSLSSYPDLFYALQGAGQMTGIVVAFYATLQPVREDGLVRVVTTIAPLKKGAELWDAWLPYRNQTESPLIEKSVLYVAFYPGVGPAMLVDLYDWRRAPSSAVILELHHSPGTTDFVDGWISVATERGFKVKDAETPYMEVLTSTSATQAYPGVTHYANSHIFTDIQADGILEVVEKAMAKPSSLFNLIVVDYGEDGASAKSKEDTAYSWRGKWVMYIWSFWTRTDGGAEADGDAKHVAWVKSIYDQLKNSSEGHYSNFVNFEAPEDTEMSFSPEAWVKVQAAKATYDPHHLLRELDFYHDDGGHGPLDAALEPVSV